MLWIWFRWLELLLGKRNKGLDHVFCMVWWCLSCMFGGLRFEQVGCRHLDLHQRLQSLTGWVVDSLGLGERKRVGANIIVWIVTRKNTKQQVVLWGSWGRHEGARDGKKSSSHFWQILEMRMELFFQAGRGASVVR